MTPRVRGALFGGGFGASVATLHALAWYIYFATGPTPRDFASARAFGARMFLLALAAGLVLAVPAGLALGAAATRGQGHRWSVGLAVAPFLFFGVEAGSWRGSSFFAVVIPALALAAISGAVASKLVKAVQAPTLPGA